MLHVQVRSITNPSSFLVNSSVAAIGCLQECDESRSVQRVDRWQCIIWRDLFLLLPTHRADAKRSSCSLWNQQQSASHSRTSALAARSMFRSVIRSGSLVHRRWKMSGKWLVNKQKRRLHSILPWILRSKVTGTPHATIDYSFAHRRRRLMSLNRCIWNSKVFNMWKLHLAFSPPPIGLFKLIFICIIKSIFSSPLKINSHLKQLRFSFSE